MRDHSSALADVLTGSFSRRLFVNVFHGSERVAEGLSFESWSWSGDITAKVKTGGSGTIVYPSVSGESMVPVGTRGVLSPFRARIEIVVEISAGNFREQVSLGIFRIVGMPTGQDFTTMVNGVETVIASRVTVTFRSLDENPRRRGFRSPEQPPSLVSCYDEMRRISGMPVEESVPDAPIPTAVVWEAADEGRLEAIHQLGQMLGGTALVNSVGAWTVVPDEVGPPVTTLQLGERGTVLDVADEIDTDEVYNCVVGVFEDANRNRIDAVAEVSSGDLAVEGLYEENTLYWTNDAVKTKAQAQSAVQSMLDLSIGSLQYELQIQCHINPVIELGDVVALDGWTREVVGRVVKISMSDSPYMNVSLRVARAL